MNLCANNSRTTSIAKEILTDFQTIDVFVLIDLPVVSDALVREMNCLMSLLTGNYNNRMLTSTFDCCSDPRL